MSAKHRPSERKRCGTAGNRDCTGIEKWVCADLAFLRHNSRTNWLRRRRTLHPVRQSQNGDCQPHLQTHARASAISMSSPRQRRPSSRRDRHNLDLCKYYTTLGLFLRHLARRSHHLCILRQASILGAMHDSSDLKTQYTVHRDDTLRSYTHGSRSAWR